VIPKVSRSVVDATETLIGAQFLFIVVPLASVGGRKAILSPVGVVVVVDVEETAVDVVVEVVVTLVVEVLVVIVVVVDVGWVDVVVVVPEV